MSAVNGKKRVFITGAGGFVGTRAMAYFAQQPDWEVFAFPSEVTRRGDSGEIADYLLSGHADYLIHTAAISDTGLCEREPEASFRANVELPLAFCRACEKTRVRLAAFSSDQVYNGCTEEGPYPEDAVLHPQNVYGRHKLQAEIEGLSLCPDAVFLRAEWMYDFPVYGQKKRTHFLYNVLRAATENRTLSFSQNTFRGITYVRSAAERLADVMNLPGGVYNFGSENPLSVYDTAAAALQAFGLEERIPALLRADESTKRHNLWVSLEKLRGYGVDFSDTAEDFVRCAADYGWN